jgi:hypothetical protein
MGRDSEVKQTKASGQKQYAAINLQGKAPEKDPGDAKKSDFLSM